MRHVVVVQQIASQRFHELRRAPVLQPNFVVDPRIIYQHIEPTTFSDGLFDGGLAEFRG